MSVHARAVASSQRQPARPCNAVPSIIRGTKRYGCIAASLDCSFSVIRRQQNRVIIHKLRLIRQLSIEVAIGKQI